MEVASCPNHKHGLIDNGCFDHWLSFPPTKRLFHVLEIQLYKYIGFIRVRKLGEVLPRKSFTFHVMYYLRTGGKFPVILCLTANIKLPYGYQFSCSQRCLRTPWPWRWKNIEFVLAGFKHIKPLSQTSIWKTEHCYWRWSLVRSWHK